MKQLAEEESFRAMVENPSMKIFHDDFDAYVHDLVGTRPLRRG